MSISSFFLSAFVRPCFFLQMRRPAAAGGFADAPQASLPMFASATRKQICGHSHRCAPNVTACDIHGGLLERCPHQAPPAPPLPPPPSPLPPSSSGHSASPSVNVQLVVWASIATAVAVASSVAAFSYRRALKLSLARLCRRNSNFGLGDHDEQLGSGQINSQLLSDDRDHD